MTKTTLESLEERVSALERSMAQLQPKSPGVPWKDWRRSIGRFVPTELSEEIDAAGREIREADRRQGAQ